MLNIVAPLLQIVGMGLLFLGIYGYCKKQQDNNEAYWKEVLWFSKNGDRRTAIRTDFFRELFNYFNYNSQRPEYKYDKEYRKRTKLHCLKLQALSCDRAPPSDEELLKYIEQGEINKTWF